MAYLQDLVGLGTVAVVDAELEVLERALHHQRVRLLRLAVGRRGIAVVDVAEGGHVGILLLVGGLQLLHHGVHLRLLPHVVLLHAKLTQHLDVNAIFPEFLFHRLRICWQR